MLMNETKKQKNWFTVILKMSKMNSLNRIFIIVLIMLKPIQFLKIIFVSVLNKEAHKKFKIFKQNQKPHFN